MLGLVGLVAGLGTYPAFSQSATNPGNSFAAGTVTLSDNDSGAGVLSLEQRRSVRYRHRVHPGHLQRLPELDGPPVRELLGALVPYLTLTVTRGTDSSPSFPSCAGLHR